jgi:uncharacterized protein YjbI with pentapeptide repeats
VNRWVRGGAALLLLALLGGCVRGEDAVGNGAGKCVLEQRGTCRGADLSGMDLSGMDLSGMDLTGADLSDANLSDANLSGAILELVRARKADFTGANLSGADLAVADLARSRMTAADFTGADLREANLHLVDARGSDFAGALLLRTNLAGADLREVSAFNAVVSATVLTGARLDGSDWRGSVVRDEEMPSEDHAMLLIRGAFVCGFVSCTGTVWEDQEDAARVDVTAEAVTAALANVSRAALTNFETPNLLSRASAFAMLAAVGVYPEPLVGPIRDWEPAHVSLPDGLRDAAALYALANTSAGVRWNPAGPSFNGRLRTLMSTRDVTFWEITREHPTSRSRIAAGATVSSAAALLRAESDGFAGRTMTFNVTGAWKPTPPGFASGVEPGWGSITAFHPEADACEAGIPAADQTAEARKVLVVTRDLTEDQRTAARFWDDERIRTSTPVGHWHNIATLLLEERGPRTLRERLELLTRLHTGMADTLIRVWSEKYRYQTARPVTLLEGVEPGWNSYLGNPSFPAYPSGHAAVSAFASRLLAEELGEGPFVDSGAVEAVARLGLNVPERAFDSLEEAGVEAGMSRIWGGIHVPDDFDGGRRLGHCLQGLGRR